MTPASTCSSSGCHRPLPQVSSPSFESCEVGWRRHYRPLSVEAQEIRLVRILADEHEAPLRCELIYTILEHTSTTSSGNSERLEHGQISWQALSYVWGDSLVDVSIYLNGDLVPVRQNLHECLIWLRHHGCVEPVWIDALCIDQANLMERSSQVQAMPQIYGAAVRVIVYIKVTEKSAVDQVDMKQELRTMFKSERALTDSMHLWFKGNNEALLNSVAYILHDEYWRRQWTLQEFVLARSLVLVSGPLLLPIEIIKKIQSKSSMFVGQLVNFGSTDYRPHRIIAMTGGRFARRMSLRGEKKGSKKGKDRQLLEILTKIRGNQCSDPRDYIYGLLGLAHKPDPLQPNLPIDYTLCTACVWHQTTIFLIKSTNKLDVLAYCSYDLSNFQTTSWVPNWASINSFVERLRYRQPEPTIIPHIQISDNGMRLSATGRIMGTSSRSVAANSVKPDISQSTKELLAVISDVVSSAKTLVDSFTEQERCIEMLALLMAEFNEGVDKILTTMKAYLATCARDLHGNGLIKETEDLMVYLKAFLRDTAPTRLFLVNPGSEMSILGVSSYPWHEGDIVCELHGCKTPLIIRREMIGDRIVGT